MNIEDLSNRELLQLLDKFIEGDVPDILLEAYLQVTEEVRRRGGRDNMDDDYPHPSTNAANSPRSARSAST